MALRLCFLLTRTLLSIRVSYVKGLLKSELSDLFDHKIGRTSLRASIGNFSLVRFF
jgi:putative copper export protein